ncbi:MAG: PhoH family protein [Gammaproteobacteria bacterium]|nr:PhoH family protein [Gammaproteobacteria bacterium]MBT6074106.1 PhoH family protein [Gammaproteobacteria bacterium]MDG2435176.1 PhoH family protein [Gammaproteobacteria bacterium]
MLGIFDKHLRIIEHEFKVEIKTRGGFFVLTGEQDNLNTVERVIRELYFLAQSENLSHEKVHLVLRKFMLNTTTKKINNQKNGISINTPNKKIHTQNKNQNDYIQAIRKNDLSFGIGPAGTGKTYLAVATAIEALQKQTVKKIILVRPAVEAGERLGFLPGDLSQKVDPYLRPMYDALFEMLGFDQVTNLIERKSIELAPLAFMRGRSLNESFIILDEAQNTTIEQMKMFLTRMGYGSKSVVNGDITQIDLPSEKESGLKHVLEVIKHLKNVGVINFNHKDVIRHQIVQDIVEAYQKHKN